MCSCPLVFWFIWILDHGFCSVASSYLPFGLVCPGHFLSNSQSGSCPQCSSPFHKSLVSKVFPSCLVGILLTGGGSIKYSISKRISPDICCNHLHIFSYQLHVFGSMKFPIFLYIYMSGVLIILAIAAYVAFPPVFSTFPHPVHG